MLLLNIVYQSDEKMEKRMMKDVEKRSSLFIGRKQLMVFVLNPQFCFQVCVLCLSENMVCDLSVHLLFFKSLFF